MQFRVIVVADPQTNTPTNTQTHIHKPTDSTDYNTLRRNFASAQCENQHYLLCDGIGNCDV